MSIITSTRQEKKCLFGKCCTLFFTGYTFYLAWHNPVYKQTLMYSRCKNVYWFCLYVIVPNQEHLLSLFYFILLVNKCCI